MDAPITNPRQTTLREISTILREFDFENFNPREDKMALMNELQLINSKLGKILGGFDNG
jgi:hypothetical protein